MDSNFIVGIFTATIGLYILYMIWESIRKKFSNQKSKEEPNNICTQCGLLGNPKIYTKGSVFIEIMVWIFFIILGLIYSILFIVPALIYSVYRMTTKYKACPVCGGNMIPKNSPIGRKILQNNNLY